MRSGATVTSQEILGVIEEGPAAAASAPAPTAPAPIKTPQATPAATPPAAIQTPSARISDLSPAGQRVASENRIDPAQVSGTGRGGQVTKEDLVNFMRGGGQAAAPASAQPAALSPAPSAPRPTPGPRPEERVPM